MLVFTILLIAASLTKASSLQCLHNSTVTRLFYDNGMLTRADAANYNMGVLECSAKLTRCVNFKAMDVSFFNTLDVAQDASLYVSLIKKGNGKVVGRACMSERDCEKIEAREALDCTGNPPFSCFCTTDGCTGASGGQTTLMSSIVALLTVVVAFR